MIFAQAYFGETFVNNHPVLYSVLIWISVAYLLTFCLFDILRILDQELKRILMRRRMFLLKKI